MNEPKSTVILGISGGIAAYKCVDVVSQLCRQEMAVHVAMSDAAQEFVTPLTFAAISGERVLTELFPKDPSTSKEAAYPHLYPATRADVCVIAPATADVISKLAHGVADELIPACVLSLPAHCQRLFAPAMNVEMWESEATQENVERLESKGWVCIGPNEGVLACGMHGFGRMAEPSEIVQAITDAVASREVLLNKKVLILSGPTREHLDPVRFIGNASSGKMGQALAEQAQAMGASVHMVTGPVDERRLPRGEAVQVEHIRSAEEMLKAARAAFDGADIVIYAAAVADYRPAVYCDEKGPKSAEAFELSLVPTPDIASELHLQKRPGQVTIGFALQTEVSAQDARARAEGKLRAKGFDGIVLNDLDALGGEDGSYTFLRAGQGDASACESWGPMTKRACAKRILEEAVAVGFEEAAVLGR